MITEDFSLTEALLLSPVGVAYHVIGSDVLYVVHKRNEDSTFKDRFYVYLHVRNRAVSLKDDSFDVDYIIERLNSTSIPTDRGWHRSLRQHDLPDSLVKQILSSK